MIKAWKIALLLVGASTLSEGAFAASTPAPAPISAPASLPVAASTTSRDTKVIPSIRAKESACLKRGRRYTVRYRGRKIRARYVGSRIVRRNGRLYRVRYFRR